MNDLHTKYRPTKFSEVHGQKDAITALQTVIKKGTSHAFLLTGPSGVGKTTMARIAARRLGVLEGDLLEVDAASNSGVDDIRTLVDRVSYMPAFGGARAYIIDECHTLSKQAWQAVLKACEEPPEHFYWFFCTTEVGRVPNTIKTRCSCVHLNDIDRDDMIDRLEQVCDAEGMQLDEDILGVIANSAVGSMRAALVGLAMCSKAKTKEQAASILRMAVGDKDMRDFVRALYQGQIGSWQNMMEHLNSLGEFQPENLRIVITGYLTKVLEGCKSDKKAAHILTLLSCFKDPYFGPTPRVSLYLSLGEVLYSQED